MLPLAAGPFAGRAAAALASDAVPVKTVTFVRNGRPETVRTHAATIGDLLIERNVVRSSEDILDADPAAVLENGATVHLQSAVPVTLVVDDVSQTVRTSAATVGALLAERSVVYDAHDRLEPAGDTLLSPDAAIRLTHLNVWTETVRQPIVPPVRHVPSLSVGLGKIETVDPGVEGMKETSYLVTRGADRTVAPRRALISARVTRTARPRVVAHGIGAYALSRLALRGFDATVRVANTVLTMMATAYTASCNGCSGTTKLGQPAGHGIVAVDPRVIPLGTQLYIPGYGRAIAGDTGGSIVGNRIDLGFDSTSDAFQFGTRPIVVYVLHK
jgi:3D (Asp-Asp-Asp) domain-containing protein